MILRLRTQVLEYRLLPIPFHMVPIINHPVSDGIMDAIAGRLGVGQRFIANEEVEIFHPAFRR